MNERNRFIQEACAFSMHATKNEAERREHAAALVATAQALADALDMPDLGPQAPAAVREFVSEEILEQLRDARQRNGDLEALCASYQKDLDAARRRIEELIALHASQQADLERATAPKPATASRGGR